MGSRRAGSSVVWFATLLAVVVCQTLPPQQQATGVNFACFNTLRISRHINRPSSGRVMDLHEHRENFEYVSLARHHIIPYATMRDFYNNVLMRDIVAFTRLFNDVIFPAADHVGVSVELGSINVQEYYLPELEELTETHLLIRTEDQVVLLREVYAWLPFNIYIGPSPADREDDDRANAFDETARVIIGDPRADVLMNLYSDIRRYNTNPNSVNVNTIIGRMADLVYVQRMPFDFDPSQWRVRQHINEYRFRVATEEVRNDHNRYRELRPDDYCNPDSLTAYNRYLAREQLRRRRRNHIVVEIQTNCVIRENNNDAFCIRTLNIIRDSIRDKKIVKNNSTTPQPSNVKYDEPLDPNPKLTNTGWFLHFLTLGLWP